MAKSSRPPREDTPRETWKGRRPSNPSVHCHRHRDLPASSRRSLQTKNAPRSGNSGTPAPEHDDPPQDTESETRSRSSNRHRREAPAVQSQCRRLGRQERKPPPENSRPGSEAAGHLNPRTRTNWYRTPCRTDPPTAPFPPRATTHRRRNPHLRRGESDSSCRCRHSLPQEDHCPRKGFPLRRKPRRHPYPRRPDSSPPCIRLNSMRHRHRHPPLRRKPESGSIHLPSPMHRGFHPRPYRRPVDSSPGGILPDWTDRRHPRRRRHPKDQGNRDQNCPPTSPSCRLHPNPPWPTSPVH